MTYWMSPQQSELMKAEYLLLHPIITQKAISPGCHTLITSLTYCSVREWKLFCHYNGVIMSVMASQITSLTIVHSTLYSGADQRKHQSSASLAFVRGIYRWSVNSPHKGPVTQKMFPFDEVIMVTEILITFPVLNSHFTDHFFFNIKYFYTDETMGSGTKFIILCCLYSAGFVHVDDLNPVINWACKLINQHLSM